MADFEGTVINAASTDAWQELRCPGTMLVIFHVFNAGILYQLGRGEPAAVFDGRSQPLFPGFHPRTRLVDAVRFKSLVGGTPAQVSIETATPADVGGVIESG